MSHLHNLKENTWLFDQTFPFNIFDNNSKINIVLYLHWHEHIEIIYMIEGNAIFDIGGKIIQASAGDILFINSGQLHSGYNVNNNNVRFYAIVFSKSLIASDLTDSSYTKYFAPFLNHNYVFPSIISKNNSLNAKYRQNIENMINEFNDKLPGYQLKIRLYLYSVLIDIIRDFKPSNDIMIIDDTYEKNVECIKKLILYLQQNYNKKITIKEAAKYVNLSPYYFCKVFKKVTGRTYIEFVNLNKINKAEELLKNTSLSITQIAEELGFCNINYFDKIFKKFKNYSPTKYRKV